MRVYIVFAAGHIDASIVSCLSELADVDLIGYSMESGEALRQIADNSPDIVIVNAESGEERAWLVLNEVRILAYAPFIIITSHSTHDYFRHYCLSSGAHAFLELPKELDGLREILFNLY